LLAAERFFGPDANGKQVLVDFFEPDLLYDASARAIEIASLSDAIRHLRMSQKAAVSEPKSGQNAPIKPRDESDESGFGDIRSRAVWWARIRV
jgi:hypothetical protein